MPHALRQRVVGFYEYVTDHLKSLDAPEVIRMLPRPMQLHLLIVTNRRLFTDVALFFSPRAALLPPAVPLDTNRYARRRWSRSACA